MNLVFTYLQMDVPLYRLRSPCLLSAMAAIGISLDTRQDRPSYLTCIGISLLNQGQVLA
jgi:hypothetical protein